MMAAAAAPADAAPSCHEPAAGPARLADAADAWSAGSAQTAEPGCSACSLCLMGNALPVRALEGAAEQAPLRGADTRAAAHADAGRRSL